MPRPPRATRRASTPTGAARSRWCPPASRSSCSPATWSVRGCCARRRTAIFSWPKAAPIACACCVRRPTATKADTVEIFASGLSRPFGINFYPPGPNPQWVYVANSDSIVRFPYRNGDLKARDKPGDDRVLAAERRPLDPRPGVLARRPQDVRLGRLGLERGRRPRLFGRRRARQRHRPAVGQRERPRGGAGVRSRRQEQARVRHRAAGTASAWTCIRRPASSGARSTSAMGSATIWCPII